MSIAMTAGRRLRVGAIALVVVIPLAGCGGSSDKSREASQTAAWADGACSAVTTWKSSLESAATTLKDVDNLSKAKVEQAASDVSAANDRLAKDVDALGEPPKGGGSEAKAAVDELGKELKASANEIRNAVQDVSGVTGVLEAVSFTSGALVTMSNDISATATTLDSIDAGDEWKKAFDDSAACRSLSSG